MSLQKLVDRADDTTRSNNLTASAIGCILQLVMSGVTSAELQQILIAFIRAFGLHQPERTPCGKALSVSDAHALMELSSGGALSQSELAGRLGLEKSSVSRLVQQLQVRGWLNRIPDETDGRIKRLVLSEQGQRVASDVATARRMKFDVLLVAIPEAERVPVLAALETLVHACHTTLEVTHES